MSHDLFDDVVDPSIHVGPRHWSSVPLSIASHLVVIGVLVGAPLLATTALPTPDRVLATVTLPKPVTPLSEPRPAPVRSVAAATASPPSVAVPYEAPDTITDAPTSEATAPPAWRVPTGASAASGTVSPATGVTLASAPAAVPTGPLPVGGKVLPPSRLTFVQPIYPVIAKNARVQGTVTLEAVIGKDGSVQDVRVTKSIKLLDQSAVDAVRQWRYSTPTLNGQPIEVIMTVTVDFALQ